MAIIHTQRNRVYSYDRRPDDVLLEIGLLGPAGDGKLLRPVNFPYFPIAAYQEWVDWAVAIADQMAHPIHIVPLNHNDFFDTGRFEPFRQMLANLTEGERAEMRHLAKATCADVLRDCCDGRYSAAANHMPVEPEAVRE